MATYSEQSWAVVVSGWQEEVPPVVVGNCDGQLSSSAYQCVGLVFVLLFSHSSADGQLSSCAY